MQCQSIIHHYRINIYSQNKFKKKDHVELIPDSYTYSCFTAQLSPHKSPPLLIT